MISPKIFRCIVLIWLPLVALKINRKDEFDEHSKIENDDLPFGGNSKKNTSAEKTEEKLIKSLADDRNIRLFSRNKTTGENSANSKHEKLLKTNAHKHSVMRSTSALSFNKIININKFNSERKKSAILVKGIRKKGEKKLLIENDSLKIIKREAKEDRITTTERTESGSFTSHGYDENLNDIDNKTELGSYLGGPCESECNEKLLHVFCHPTNRICECDERYPVQIDNERGCEKPKQLGDQCFYAQTCSFSDPNSDCIQINHNAICQCKPGFHTVALKKGVKRKFCSEDIIIVSADLPTLLGVATGIAVLTGLLCFVLRLFSGSRYPATRHYGNANLAPPLLYSNDNQWINGIPLTVQANSPRPSSRSSCQRSNPSLTQIPRNKGVMVPASRAGAARAAAILLIPCHLQASRRHSCSDVINNISNDGGGNQENEVEHSSRIGSRRQSLSSVQSTASSQKSLSYSARRFEQENQQREQRAAMRAAREEAARLESLPTPSPMSAEDILLLSTGSNTEEDLLCTSKANIPGKSEPPAIIGQKETLSSVMEN